MSNEPGTARIAGLADLQAALDTLPAKVEANLMRGALRAGTKVIAKAAAANVHSISGDLAASVRFGARLDRAGGTMQAYVRAGRGGKAKPRGAFYAGMVEFGTAAHVIAAKPGHSLAVGGGHVAKVHHPGAKKHPFMRPAADAQQTAAAQAVAEYLRRRLATRYGIDVPAPVDPEAAE